MFSEKFDPLSFFEAPTFGAATVVDFTGRLLRRCTVTTQSEPNVEFGSLHFDERFTFDDGSPDDVMNWAVKHTDQGIDAREPSVDGELWSHLDGPTWRLRFRRLSGLPMIYKVTFTQVTPTIVLKLVRLQRFGVTLARMDGFHERKP